MSLLWYIKISMVGAALLWISVVRVCYLLSFRLTDILWLQSDWQPCGAQPASCLARVSYITILRHGPLPSHSTQAINTTTPPPSTPLCTLFSSSYRCCYANMLEEAQDRSPLVICVTAASVTCYVKMLIGVSGFEPCCTIYTEGWSVAKFSSFLWASSWTSVEFVENNNYCFNNNWSLF